jgi:hypothetical protein
LKVNPSPGIQRVFPCLHEVVRVHEDAFAITTVSRAMRRRVMLMAKLLRIEAPIIDLALPFLLAAMGWAVLGASCRLLSWGKNDWMGCRKPF